MSQKCEIAKARPGEECDAEAAYRWVWGWGEPGQVCERHVHTIKSLAEQLGQALRFQPMQAPASAEPAPSLELDEAVQELAAVRQELEALRLELGETKRRNVALSQRNEDLQSDVDKLRRQLAELEPSDSPG